MDNNNCGKKLCICKLAFALALTGALFTFILGICGWLFGYGIKVIELYGSIYPGFTPSFLGSIIGAIWAFIEIFLFIVITGFIYCKMMKKCNKCFCCNKKNSDPNQPSNE